MGIWGGGGGDPLAPILRNGFKVLAQIVEPAGGVPRFFYLTERNLTQKYRILGDLWANACESTPSRLQKPFCAVTEFEKEL